MSRSPLLKIEPSTGEEGASLTKWLLDPIVLRGFPMTDEKEIDDSVRVWMSYMKKGMGLAAWWDGTLCGIATLYIQPFQKLAHTCLFSIVVSEEFRGRGIGTALLGDLIELAKHRFHIEILHLEVYEGNPAERLYKRLGFEPFGKQGHFSKEGSGQYRAKIFMQKDLRQKGS